MPLPPAESTACHCCTACGRDNALEPNNYIKVMERRNVCRLAQESSKQPAERTPHMDDKRPERRGNFNHKSKMHFLDLLVNFDCISES